MAGKLSEIFTKSSANIIASAVTGLGFYLWAQFQQHTQETRLSTLELKSGEHDEKFQNLGDSKQRVYQSINVLNEHTCAGRVEAAVANAKAQCAYDVALAGYKKHTPKNN